MTKDHELSRVSFDYDDGGVYRVRVGDRVFLPEGTPTPAAAAALRLVEAMREWAAQSPLLFSERVPVQVQDAYYAALPASKPPSLRERLERVFACAEPTRPEDVISALRAHLAEHPDATLCDVLTEGAAAHPEDAEAVGRMCGDA